MQASQGFETTEEIKDVSKERPLPASTKQGPKKLSPKAQKRERIREKACVRKVIGRLQQKQAKTIDSPHNEAVRKVKPRTSQATANSPTKIEASAGEKLDISKTGDQEASSNDSARNSPGRQSAIAQKLDDIMDVLETSKDPKKSGKPVEALQGTSGMETKSADTELQRVVRAILEELQDRRESSDKPPHNAAAATSHSRRGHLAPLKPISEEVSLVAIHISFDNPMAD